MTFNYFYNNESQQFSFFRVPKYLITGNEYSGLSTNAKLLYGLVFDRMDLAYSNDWIDDENKVYIIYPIAEIADDLNVSNKKAIEYLNELETYHLIEKKSQKLGFPNLLYVHKFILPVTV